MTVNLVFVTCFLLAVEQDVPKQTGVIPATVTHYTITDLGEDYSPEWINNAGQIAGTRSKYEKPRAAVWEHGQWADAPVPLNKAISYGNLIDGLGRVIGSCGSGKDADQMFIADKGRARVVLTPAGYDRVEPDS